MRSYSRWVIASAVDVRSHERAVTVRARDGFCSADFLAMGSPCEVLVDTTDTASAEQLAHIAAAEAWRIEDKFSRYVPNNVVASINAGRGETVEVDEETAGLLDFSASLFAMSDGRFDITSGVLREAWTFDGGDRLPEKNRIKALLNRVGWEKVTWQPPRIRLPKNMQVDFGGIGKEYAVDRAAGLLRDATDTACLVNFGGDLVVNGTPLSGGGWRVGIDAFADSKLPVAKTIRISTGALATSGNARRFLLKDGVRYGHILNPVTGWPVKNAPRSITVAADTCTQAGMLATLAMLRGRDAETFLEDESVRYWCYR